MTSWRRVAFLLLGTVAWAADPPEFTAAGVALGARPARMLVPGRLLTIYGTNLGPAPGRCGEAIPLSAYPTQFCGTRVLLGDMPAQLLYVSDKQINFKVPQDLPAGLTAVRVTYDGQASRPVEMQAGFETTTVALEGPAFSGMPVWVKIDLPADFGDSIRYPFNLGPAGLGCHQLELRRDGQEIPLLPGANWMRFGFGIGGNICGSYSPAKEEGSRLPLHLLFKLEPGRYEVRYTLRSMPAGIYSTPDSVRTRSPWSAIEIQAARRGQRAAWLQSIR